jgi:hypothetical protein
LFPPTRPPPGSRIVSPIFDFSQFEYSMLSNRFDRDGINPNVLWHSGSNLRTGALSAHCASRRMSGKGREPPDEPGTKRQMH